MIKDTEQMVLADAKSLYDNDRKTNVNFSKGPVVTFEAITQDNAAYVHEATVKLGARCDQHDHSQPSAQQILMDAERHVRKANQAKAKFAADKKRLMGMTETGKKTLEAQQAAQPNQTANMSNMSKHESEKARLIGKYPAQTKELFTTRSNPAED